MCAFVVLGFVFFIPSQEIGLGNVSEMTCCVEWDVKPQPVTQVDLENRLLNGCLSVCCFIYV